MHAQHIGMGKICKYLDLDLELVGTGGSGTGTGTGTGTGIWSDRFRFQILKSGIWYPPGQMVSGITQLHLHFFIYRSGFISVLHRRHNFNSSSPSNSSAISRSPATSNMPRFRIDLSPAALQRQKRPVPVPTSSYQVQFQYQKFRIWSDQFQFQIPKPEIRQFQFQFQIQKNRPSTWFAHPYNTSL
ncbi:hypothetical protein LXL04_036472 [Taraxacum kok-saghyz]